MPRQQRLTRLPVAAALLQCLVSATAFQQPLSCYPLRLATRIHLPLQAHRLLQHRHRGTTSPPASLPVFARLSSTPTTTATISTSLFMYNLPPSGGGAGGGKDNVVTQVLGGVLSLAAIVLFFASPLGGIFFAITNSFFLLLLLTPILLTIAFNVWQAFNTIEGTCPNCGAPKQRVLKDPGTPGLCMNCGTFLRATPDQKSIEFIDLERDAFGVVDMDQPIGSSSSAEAMSMLDQLFGGQPTRSSVQSGEASKKKASQFRREQTVIDIDVEDKGSFQ